MNNEKRSLTPEYLESILSRVAVGILLAVIGAVAVFLTFFDRPEISVQEKRKLEPMPKLSASAIFSGSYTKDFTKFYTDTVPMRDDLVNLGSSFNSLLGFRVGGVKIHGNTQRPTDDLPPDLPPDTPPVTEPKTEPATDPVTDPVSGLVTDPVTDEVSDIVTEPITEPATEPATDPATEPVTEPLPDLDEALYGDVGIIVLNKRAIMLYYGSYTCTLNYVNEMENYKRLLGDSVNVWSMITPTHVSFYMPDKYKHLTNDQPAHIKYAEESFKTVTEINSYEALLPHVNENIYTRTDHHWSTLGAYYAAEAFAKKAGVPFADISTYEKYEREGYVGTMYTYTEDAVLKNNPETFVYYKPQNEYSVEYFDRNVENGFKSSLFFDWVDTPNSYLVFIGSDDRVTHITTDCKNGRKLFIIKDSYGNALVPFLTGSFEEIWVADIRYFTKNTVEFMKENGITDFLCSTCAFFSCGTLGAPYLESLRNQ